MLSDALKERNRLFHHFYREHNIRINSSAGRAIMLADLEAVHETLTEVYNKLLLMSGTDVDELTEPASTRCLITLKWPQKRTKSVAETP